MTEVPTNTIVTIFGGSGFLGRHVVHALAKAGFRLRVASRRPNLANHLMPAGRVGQIALVRCDIRDEAQVAAAVTGASAVVNLVGILRGAFEEIHVDGAAAIAKAAAKAGARRLIHVSAIGASTESRSAYARSKAEGEAAVRAAFPDATILRPSIVFGPGDGFFNRFAALMRLSPFVFPAFGGGTTKFQPVFAGDVAEALAHALKDAHSRRKTYELGGPAIYTFKELLTLVSQVTQRKRTLVPIPFFLLDIGAALTGWLPFAPVTLDQARLLRVDNVVHPGVGTLADLAVQPTSVEAIVPTYLYAFRRTGQYVEPRGA